MSEMTYNGRPVYTTDTIPDGGLKIGDHVSAEYVMEMMDVLPPACMRRSCAQLGEPYSHREDPETGRWRATYMTFKCLTGDFTSGVWEYCGNCFQGENTERGKDPIIV